MSALLDAYFASWMWMFGFMIGADDKGETNQIGQCFLYLIVSFFWPIIMVMSIYTRLSK